MVKIKQSSLTIIVLIFAVMLMLLGITASGLLNVNNYIIPAIKISGVLIVFSEIGLLTAIKSKGNKLSFFTSVELIIASLVALEVIVSAVFNTGILSNLSGWILLAFGIIFIVEVFYR